MGAAIVPMFDINPFHWGDAVVGGAAEHALELLGESIMEAVSETVATLGTFWTKVDTPGVGSGSVAARLQHDLSWYMSALAVLSVILAGGKMAFELRAEPGRQLLKSLITLILVTGAGVASVSLLLTAGDQYSTWIINQGSGGGFGENLSKMFLAASATGSGLGVALVIVLGLIAVLLSLGQIIMMIFRSVALVLVVGVWPASAAATNTAMGKQWFDKISGYVLAFVLYKPAASTVYAAAFMLFSDGDGLMSVLMGCAAMVLGLVAMPALMKLAVPAVGSMGSGGAGGGMGAALGSGGMMLAGRGSSSSSSSSSSGAGGNPSGAVQAPPMQAPASSGAGGGGASGGASSGAGAGAAGGGAAGGGAAAGGAAAAAGPVGAAVVAAGAVKEVVQQVGQKVASTAQSAVDEGGPSGSK